MHERFFKMAEFRSLKDDNGDPLVDNFRPTQPLNGRVIYCNGKCLLLSNLSSDHRCSIF